MFLKSCCMLVKLGIVAVRDGADEDVEEEEEEFVERGRLM
jgi:hypothetical protein